MAVFQALAGGILIGLGAVLLMLVDGRIAGISGILGGALTGVRRLTRDHRPVRRWLTIRIPAPSRLDLAIWSG